MENLFRRRYLISLTYMLVVVIGIAAWQTISLEEAPNLNRPSITVSYGWGTTSPEIVEKEITRKVEQAANRLRDVERIESITNEGRSQVTVRFNKRAPVEFRKVELQEYLAGLQESMPPTVGDPSVSHSVPEELEDSQTLLSYSISGPRQVNELLEYVRENIRLPLLGIDGVSEISVGGGTDPALVFEFNPVLVQRYNLDPDRIASQVRTNFSWRSSGYIESSGSRYSMLVPPQFDNLEDIRDIRIRIPDSERRIRLREIAAVSIQDTPSSSLTRINGDPALTITFTKRPGADAMRLAERLRGRMDQVESELPEELYLRLTSDSTEDLREQFGSLQYQALMSILVVFLVLLAFIRRFRAPFVILGSVIFSLLLSISILYFIGYTLNVLTLAGLTVALGMIIDNAVVVFEQVNPRLPKERSSRIRHVREQLPRSLVPVLGSTFTTVGIFVPLFFAMEELQLFLVPLAVALSSTLVSSVFIALSWIPYSLIWLVPARSGEEQESSKGSKGFFRRVRGGLLRMFHWRRRFRWVFYAGLIAVLGIPLWAIDTPAFDDEETDTRWPEFTRVYFDNRADIDPWIGGLPYRFFNDTYFGSPWGGSSVQQSISISIDTPQGTPMDQIDKMARNFEKIAQPYAEAFDFYRTTVSEVSESASLRFVIKDEYLTQPEPYIYYAEAQFLAARTGNSGISVSGLGDGIYTGLGGSSIGRRIYLTGYSYEGLLEVAEDLERRLKRSRRVQEVDIHGSGFSSSDLYQYYLDLDERELALRGIDPGDLYQAISMDVNPRNQAGQIEMNGNRLNMIIRNRTRTERPELLLDKKRYTGADSTMFTVDQVAEVARQKSQASIRRENQSYFRTVSVDFLGPYRLANDYIEGVIEETPTPVGVTISQTRSGVFSFGNQENTRNLLFLLGMTVLSVWMIVSALLESWVDPLIVIMAVPLSLIGIMAGTLYHDMAFDQGAIAGTLLCVGVVVNNSILLMHEKQYFRALDVHGARSWLYVYKNKMRAVLITTLTTMGGLFPIFLLSEHDLWQPLSTVVIWGLSGSTILLLLLMGIWEENSPAVSAGRAREEDS